VISGLDIGFLSPSDAQIQMLVEYLTGEEGGVEDQVSASRISRLIIVGNSLATPSARGENGENGREKKSVSLTFLLASPRFIYLDSDDTGKKGRASPPTPLFPFQVIYWTLGARFRFTSSQERQIHLGSSCLSNLFRVQCSVKSPHYRRFVARPTLRI